MCLPNAALHSHVERCCASSELAHRLFLAREGGAGLRGCCPSTLGIVLRKDKPTTSKEGAEGETMQQADPSLVLRARSQSCRSGAHWVMLKLDSLSAVQKPFLQAPCATPELQTTEDKGVQCDWTNEAIVPTSSQDESTNVEVFVTAAGPNVPPARYFPPGGASLVVAVRPTGDFSPPPPPQVSCWPGLWGITGHEWRDELDALLKLRGVFGPWTG